MAASSDGRDLARLLASMNEVLRTLTADADPAEALRASFEAAAAGFSAQKALLLVVVGDDPLELRAVHTRGVHAEQVRSCERGETVEGLSPSLVRRVAASGQAELIEDPRREASAIGTGSLAGQDRSVLCAPIRDPLAGRTLAVLYFQHSRVRDPYTHADLAWLDGYATAVGRACGAALGWRRRERELEERLSRGDAPADAPDILGDSPSTRKLRRALHAHYIPQIGTPRPDPILILGERGAGKDLVARYLHAYGGRRRRPFVAVSGAEISDDLAAARLFGHKRGSFTGAQSDERGLFRAAEGGLLFLDEVADLGPRAQACLLRVLENHAVVPVGESREVPVDVAVVLATNGDLDEAVRAGRMRADFHDRFRVQAIRLTPLRERPEDLVLLLDHFRRAHEHRLHKKTLGFTAEAFRLLAGYSWPGNVREAARVCSLLASQAPAGGWIDQALLAELYPAALEHQRGAGAAAGEQEPSLADALRAFKRELILSRLQRYAGNVRAARRSLKLGKSTFHRYARELRIPGRRSRRQAP